MLETINGIKMIQCGDYFWRVLEENDGTHIYQMVLDKPFGDLMLLYGDGNFTIRNFSTFYGGSGDFFIFKIPFDETPTLVKSLIEGEGCTIAPIYHKDTIKIKNQV